LALETRAAHYAVFAEPARDETVRRAVAALDHADTRFSVEAERTVLASLGGGCQIPIGVHCAPLGDQGSTFAWHIHAQVLAPDGEQIACVTTQAPAGVAAVSLGLQVAEDLKARGALDLLAAV
jgi:hydroxymethylbilane synthase